MEQSRVSSRSSTRSPKAMYTLLSESPPRDYSALGQLGRQEPSMFSSSHHHRLHGQRQRPGEAVFQRQRASPFKQAVRGSRLQVKSEDTAVRAQAKPPSHPGEGLMARTERALALAREQILADNDSATGAAAATPRSGRLKKGHLQPLRLVRMAGPAMDACCGIQPQKAINTFGATASVRRRGLIIANLDTTRQMYDALVNQYRLAGADSHAAEAAPQYRPDTSESIHRTSIASEEDLGELHQWPHHVEDDDILGDAEEESAEWD